jgi:ABC-type nickel/cobalt efflux system permease component RcnA
LVGLLAIVWLIVRGRGRPTAAEQSIEPLTMHNQSKETTLSTTIIAVIVVAAVGLLLLAAVLVWLAQRTRNHQRHNKAENIRGEAAEEALRVGQREALADETAAKARAAQAEADVKVAQATGLQQQAATHRSEAATSRNHLNDQRDRAEKLDPAAPADETPSSTHKEPQNL